MFTYSIYGIPFVFDSLADARSFVREHFKKDDIYANKIRSLHRSLRKIKRTSPTGKTIYYHI